jgi:hypothetical protein
MDFAVPLLIALFILLFDHAILPALFKLCVRMAGAHGVLVLFAGLLAAPALFVAVYDLIDRGWP